MLAIDLPRRIWIWVQHVKIAEYSISNLVDPTYLYDRRADLDQSPRGHLTDSADRTIDSLVFGGALVIRVLLAFERDPEPGQLRRD